MRLRLILITILTTLVSALSAQDRVTIGVDYDMLFDNTEFSSAGFPSETTFAGKLNLSADLEWDEYNHMVIGAELMNNFGEQIGNKFFAKASPIIHYRFQKQQVCLAAGIFNADLMHMDSYSHAFFNETQRYHYGISGVLAQYNSTDGESFAEFICNWEGQYSSTTREKFRILMAGRRYYDNFYWGANFSMFHFAGQPEKPHKTVVDNIILNPRLGYRLDGMLDGMLDFDIHAGAILTAQRDRGYGNEWITPSMGEVGFDLDYKWFSLKSTLYIGDDLNPFYNGNITEDGIEVEYGEELYSNDHFFRGHRGYYNRSALTFERVCFDDSVRVKAEVATHYNGEHMGSQYLLSVIVKLRKSVYDKE